MKNSERFQWQHEERKCQTKNIKDFESINPNASLNSKQLYQTGVNDQQHKQVELKSSPRFLEKPTCQVYHVYQVHRDLKLFSKAKGFLWTLCVVKGTVHDYFLLPEFWAVPLHFQFTAVCLLSS